MTKYMLAACLCTLLLGYTIFSSFSDSNASSTHPSYLQSVAQLGTKHAIPSSQHEKLHTRVRGVHSLTEHRLSNWNIKATKGPFMPRGSSLRPSLKSESEVLTATRAPADAETHHQAIESTKHFLFPFLGGIAALGVGIAVFFAKNERYRGEETQSLAMMAIKINIIGKPDKPDGDDDKFDYENYEYLPWIRYAKPTEMQAAAGVNLSHARAYDGDENMVIAALHNRLVLTNPSVTKDETQSKLRKLTTLVPDIREHVSTIPIDVLARLVVKPSDVAMRCIELRDMFPAGDLSKRIVKNMWLVDESSESITTTFKEVARLLKLEGEEHCAKVADLICDYPDFRNLELLKWALDGLEKTQNMYNPRDFLLQNPEELAVIKATTQKKQEVEQEQGRPKYASHMPNRHLPADMQNLMFSTQSKLPAWGPTGTAFEGGKQLVTPGAGPLEGTWKPPVWNTPKEDARNLSPNAPAGWKPPNFSPGPGDDAPGFKLPSFASPSQSADPSHSALMPDAPGTWQPPSWKPMEDKNPSGQL